MDFEPESFQQLAGLALFYNTENFFYLYKTTALDDGNYILNLMVCEHGKLSFSAESINISSGLIYLAAEVDREYAQFFFSLNGKDWTVIGNKLPADRLSDDYIEKQKLVFTGAMIVLCCQDLDSRTAYADFDYLRYTELGGDSHLLYTGDGVN